MILGCPHAAAESIAMSTFLFQKRIPQFIEHRANRLKWNCVFLGGMMYFILNFQISINVSVSVYVYKNLQQTLFSFKLSKILSITIQYTLILFVIGNQIEY